MIKKISVANIMLSLTLLTLVLLAVFNALLDSILPGVSLYIPILILLLALLSNWHDGKIYLRVKLPKYMLPWLFFCVFVIFGFRDNKAGSIRILSAVFLCFILVNKTMVIGKIRKIILIITGLNVFFTYFFLLFPNLYKYMIELYGYVPTGTSNGIAGYRAGISNHYSQNGIYISIFIIVVAIYIISKSNFGLKLDKKYLLYTFLGIGALLLSGKRGVIVWTALSIVVTFILTSKQKLKGIIKLMLIVLILLLILQLLSESIPELTYVFERFNSIGEDNASLERIAMIKLAITNFMKSPLLGIGFWGFRILYSKNLAFIFHGNTDKFQLLDSHNVYIQVLCETGIIGLTIYLVAIGCVLFATYKLLHNKIIRENRDMTFGLMLSLCLQIFYLIYSLSGNCLYDIVFYFYAIALIILATATYYKKQKKEENERNFEI